MRKRLGSKRREIPEDARKEIVRIYARMLNGNGEYGEFSKIFKLSILDTAKSVSSGPCACPFR